MKTIKSRITATLASVLLLAGTNAARASSSDVCQTGYSDAVDALLDDEGLCGDLNDNSRSAIIGWAMAKLENFEAHCTNNDDMEAFSLTVKKGVRILVASASSGEINRTGWLYRHKLVTWRQATALQNLVLDQNNPDDNMSAIGKVIF